MANLNYKKKKLKRVSFLETGKRTRVPAQQLTMILRLTRLDAALRLRTHSKTTGTPASTEPTFHVSISSAAKRVPAVASSDN